MRGGGSMWDDSRVVTLGESRDHSLGESRICSRNSVARRPRVFPSRVVRGSSYELLRGRLDRRAQHALHRVSTRHPNFNAAGRRVRRQVDDGRVEQIFRLAKRTGWSPARDGDCLAEFRGSLDVVDATADNAIGGEDRTVLSSLPTMRESECRSMDERERTHGGSRQSSLGTGISHRVRQPSVKVEQRPSPRRLNCHHRPSSITHDAVHREDRGSRGGVTHPSPPCGTCVALSTCGTFATNGDQRASISPNLILARLS